MKLIGFFNLSTANILNIVKHFESTSEVIMGNGHICAIYLLFFALSMPFSCFSSNNINSGDYHHELDRLYKSINLVQEHLKTTRYRRSSVLTELKTLEEEISKNSLSLDLLNKKIKKLKSEIINLKTNIKSLNNKLSAQQKALGEQMRAAYSFGTQKRLKMLLNQQDPAAMGQIQVYFDYFNKAQALEIERFMQTIEEKQNVEQSLAKTLSKQKSAQKSQKKKKKQLSKQRFKRSRLLAQIDTEIGQQEQNLSELKLSRTRIENLLNSLGELLADIPSNPTDNAPFVSQKGLLPWPIDGPFISHFGGQRQGDLKWNGVLISSPYGNPVRAISHGRVAFSDWLQGFGFITIINHDGGYMSLYGHNESLFKQVGDWVAAGDVIASTGDSGGQPVSGLYFEIRARGKPVDPTLWCISNNINTRNQVH